ncbi:interferon alpha/beta receptor 1a-like isoform X1 [Heptranchias perlo]
MVPALLCAFLTAALTLEVFGEIQSPTNIQIHALNLKYLLKWDDEQRSNYSMKYTVQYRSLPSLEAQQVNHTMNSVAIGVWKDVKGCQSISRTECDFTSKDILFLGKYILRVRAQRGSQKSAWLKSKPFTPFKQNEIGPPSVHVKSKGDLLNVHIYNPQMENNESILKFYEDIVYRISFWKNDSYETRNMKNSTGKVVPLKLEPWTTYCLRVQAFSTTFNRLGQFSPVVCEKTDGTILLWQIGVAFLISLAVVFVVVVGCSFCIHHMYRCIKYAFFPPHTLPEHIQTYFSESSQNAPFLVLASEDAEECCDQIKVISETESWSSYSGSSAPSTECEQYDQSGGTSTDSGQFSNEESSRSGGIEESEERMLTELDLHT